MLLGYTSMLPQRSTGCQRFGGALGIILAMEMMVTVAGNDSQMAMMNLWLIYG